MSELAAALLEAHVQFELRRLRGDALRARNEELVRDVFRWLADVKLDDVATRAQIMGVIDRHVITLRISGGIVELLGELSQLVFTSETSAETRLDELLGDSAYERFAEKIAHLTRVRHELVTLIARSEGAEIAHVRLITNMLGDLLLGGAPSERQRGVLRQLELRVKEGVKHVLQRRSERMAALRERRLLELLDPDLLRSIVDEVWTSVHAQRLSELFRFISQQDLEDFVVLGFEFWLAYRKSPYFRRISEEAVDHVFRKYGQQSLLALIEDMGVDAQMVRHELDELLLPLMEEAARSGFLEEQLRTQLAPFYGSAECAALLSGS